jgi:hypothetical protein
MAQGFFKHIPNIPYDFKSDGNITIAKDLFRKVSTWSHLQESVSGYSYYRITEGERPDVVADKLYGDSTLYWTFFLVNENLSSLSDWPKSQSLFNRFLDRKYSGTCLVASTSTDIVSSTSKFKLGEKVSQSSSVYGFVTDINPTFNRITLNSVEGVFTSNSTATGTDKSFVIESVVNEKSAVNHYVSQNYPNDVELKTTLYNDVPGAVLGVDLDTTVNTRLDNVNEGTYVVYPTSDKLPLSEHTGVGLSFTLSLNDHGIMTMSDITIAIPSSGYEYSEGLTVTKNMVGGQNSTSADLGSSTLAKFTINQVGNAVITNERYELDLNEDRHLIRYIEPQYIQRVTKEFIELVRS